MCQRTNFWRTLTLSRGEHNADALLKHRLLGLHNDDHPKKFSTFFSNLRLLLTLAFDGCAGLDGAQSIFCLAGVCSAVVGIEAEHIQGNEAKVVECTETVA